MSSLLDSSRNLILEESWNEEQKALYQLNVKARHILPYTLSKTEICKIYAMFNTKEMWRMLAPSHEGSNEIKRNKLTTYLAEDSIRDVYHGGE